MREYYSKIAALVVVCAFSLTAHASDVLDVKTQRQLDCLAQNIYHEAGLESFEGKVAVAQVTINRANSGNFPVTICGVVHQKTQITMVRENKPVVKTVCQFSWVCSPTKIRYLSDAWKDSLIVAQQVLYDDLRSDRLDEALYFHAVHVNPHWPLARIARIGNHIFYSNDRVTLKRSHK
jgi:spore germination cell wall hydrolase CwlJ-like protein